MFYKTSQNSQVSTCAGASRLEVYNFIKKETPTEVFSCEICETFKNSFFTKHLRWLRLTDISINIISNIISNILTYLS